MDKKNSNDTFKNRVNEIAEKFYDSKSANNKSEYKTLYNTLFSMLYLYAQKNFKIEDAYRDAYLDCVINVFRECIEKWTPEKYGFYQYYKHILDLRSKKIYKDKKEVLHDTDENNYMENIDSLENVEQDVTEELLFKYRFKLFTEVTATLKKSNENQNEISTAGWFYSEFITSGIYEKKHIDLIRKNERKIMKIVDHDFISYYLNGKNNSVDSISKGTLKSLSCFTGDKKNENELCGYPLSQKYVYLSYLSKVNGEEYTLSAINYFRKKLKETLNKAEMEQLIS